MCRTDGGPPDAGVPDASAPASDAGTETPAASFPLDDEPVCRAPEPGEAGPVDAGAAGSEDAGGPDAGSEDAGPGAGGRSDAGPPPPAGGESPRPPTATPGSAKRPALMGVALKSADDWAVWLGAQLNRTVNGSKRVLIHGNKEEYVRGTKVGLVTPIMSELVLGGKLEQTYGLEVKIVVGSLYEAFIGMKNEGTVAVTFESDSGTKAKFAPAGSNRKNAQSKEREAELKDLLGFLDEECGSSELRAGQANEKVANLLENYAKVSQTLRDAKATIGSFTGEFGNVKWQSESGWTEVCSGAYKVTAGSFLAEGDNISVKGSKVVVRKGPGGAGISCGGGKVEINKHLRVT